MPDSGEFLAALGDPTPNYDAGAFAVKNLGFIRFEILNDWVVEIELHPRSVEIAALLSAQQQLLTAKANLFRIKYLDETWQSEITSSAEKAITRLSELCSRAAPPRTMDRFRIHPRNFEDLYTNEASPLRPFAQKWRVSFGDFDESIIPFAISHGLLSRLVIIRVPSAEQDPVFGFIGDGFHWANESTKAKVMGRKVQDQPDKDYGLWASEFYKSVAASGQPRYDTVAAQVLVPAQQRQVLLHYERLLLPWKTKSDEVFVTGLSWILDETAGSARPADSVENRSASRPAKSS
jgi:hypothetical protein